MIFKCNVLLKVSYLGYLRDKQWWNADEFYRFKFSHAQFSFKRQHVASKKVPPDQGTPTLQLFPLKTGTSRPGLNFITIKHERFVLQ
jgi:hypothetical protein